MHLCSSPSASKGVWKPVRLKKRKDFLQAAAKGKKCARTGLVVQAYKKDSSLETRIGFTVTKKVGNSVVRNRVKRRLRAAIQEFCKKNTLKFGDIVLIGRDGTRNRQYDDLLVDVQQALEKVGMIE